MLLCMPPSEMGSLEDEQRYTALAHHDSKGGPRPCRCARRTLQVVGLAAVEGAVRAAHHVHAAVPHRRWRGDLPGAHHLPRAAAGMRTRV